MKSVQIDAVAPAMRNSGLDHLRALSIAVILLNHAAIGFLFSSGQVSYSGWASALSTMTVIANDWLFVLSGYLIGAIMIRSFDMRGSWWSRARSFWLRRWFRTLPTYYLFLVVHAILAFLAIAPGTFSPLYLVLSQNLFWPESQPIFFAESWSLAVNEWFYFLMPLSVAVLLFFRLSTKQAFLIASLCLILIPVILRALVPVNTDFLSWDALVRRITFLHLDATGWGLLAATLNRWHPALWERYARERALSGALVMLLGLYMVAGLQLPSLIPAHLYRFSQTASITLMAAGTFLLLPWITRLTLRSSKLAQSSTILSQYSYTVYLTHFPVMFVILHVTSLGSSSGPLELFSALVLWIVSTALTTYLVYHYYEHPIVSLRERLTTRVLATPFNLR